MNLNWMKYQAIYFLISGLIIVPGLYSLYRYGLKLSIKFTGGTQSEFQISKAQIPALLNNLSTQKPQIISQTSNTLTIKMSETSQEEVQQAIKKVSTASGLINLQSFETVGPILGAETLKKTINALLLSSILLLLYITFAFKQFKYGLCAILAMLHDTVVLFGSFSLLGHFFGVEVDLLFVTAVLTILSFSVHDTIVVYDRIRELSHKNKGSNYLDLINQSVSETMARSLNNS